MFNTIAQDTTNKLVSTEKLVRDGVNNVIGGATDAVNNAVSGAVDAVTDTANDLVNDAMGTVSDALGTVNSVVTNGLNVANTISTTAGNMKDLFNSTVSKFADTSAVDKALNDIKSSISANTNLSLDRFDEMSGSLTESLNFVTSTTKDVVDGVQSAASTVAEFTDQISDVTDAVKGKISEVAGAVTSAVDTVKNVQQKIIDTASQMISPVTDFIDYAEDTYDSVVDPIKNTLSGINNTISSVVNTYNDVVNTIDETVLGIIGPVQSTIDNLEDSINGVISSAPFLSGKVNFPNILGTSGGISGILDEFGKKVNTNLSLKDYTSLLGTASTLCPNISSAVAENFRDSKKETSIFDSLVDLSLSSRSSDLFKSLLGCTGQKSSRTTNIATSYLNDLFLEGNSDMLAVVLEVTGTSSIIDPLKKGRTLIANLDTKTSNSALSDPSSNTNKVLGMLNLDSSKLFSDDSYTGSYDAQNIIAMSLKGNGYTDSLFGKEKIQTACTILNNYK